MGETLTPERERSVSDQAAEMYAKHEELSKEEATAQEAALPKLGEEGLEERMWPEKREPALKAREEAIAATGKQLDESRAHLEANKQAYVDAAKKEAESAGHVISENPDIAGRVKVVEEKTPDSKPLTDAEQVAKYTEEREKIRERNTRYGAGI